MTDTPQKDKVMNSGHEFQFFVNSSPEKIMEKDNSSLEYIITQNDFLHKRVKDLQTKFKNVKDEKDEFEEDNERLEKKLISLRGVTINEYEMSKLLEETIKGYKLTIENHKKIEKQYKNALNNDYIIITILYIINYLLGLMGFVFPLISFYVLGITIIANNTTVSKEINEKANKIKLDVTYQNKENEYHKLRKNQDYVTTMIENL